VKGRLRLRFGAQWLAEAALLWELIRSRKSYDVIHQRQLTFLSRPVVLASIIAGKPLIVQLASAGQGKHSPIQPGSETRMYTGTLDPDAAYLRVSARSWGGSDIDRLRLWQWLAGITLRLLQSRNVTMLAVSQRMRARLLEEGFRSQQIVLLPTGIESEVYAQASLEVEARADVTVNPRLVLCVAKYRYEKGLDILLHAWKIVQARVKGTQLILVGGGPLQGQLEAMISDLGLTETVRLAGFRNDVPELLGQVDVFVLSSHYEGMSNALLEAMAAGLPCVATEVSGNEENIVNGQSGLLVPPGNPEALAEALILVLTQPGLARTLGRAARARVLDHYDRQALMQELVDLYASRIASASRKGAVAAKPATQVPPGYGVSKVTFEGEAVKRR
jgi:glycosyltransferase involved in cell wall biosynthesis